ncbi:hypothetical protein BX600DRAFT_543431 [Xylariales sp. PMI_506]|nr:hypothetical protein BX600DRAFT_543431 [Xylariales sp. PMI_506]
MVGIPGRSKACQTCLARRKACDLEHPTCKHCQRLGLQCTWNKRKVIFVNTTFNEAAHRHPSCSLRKYRYKQQAPLYPIDNSLQRSAAQSYYFGIFLDGYLGKDSANYYTRLEPSTTSWISVAHVAAIKYDILKLAMIANSVCMLGAQHGDEGAIKVGRQVYGHVLLQLVDGLGHLRSQNRLALIMTARMLALFEMFFGQDAYVNIPNGQGWVNHNIGERFLVLGNDPSLYQDGEAHQIFADGRLHLVIPDIIARKASVLGNPDWKTMPWLKIPKTPKDYLLDIVIEIPGLFEMLDMFGTECERSNGAGSKLYFCKMCRGISDGLRTWYNTTGSTIESLICANLSSGSTVTSVEDVAKGQLLLIYWCCIILYRELHEAVMGLLVDGEIIASPPPEDADAACRKILQVLAIFLNPWPSFFDINIAGFPLLFVNSYIKKQEQAGISPREKPALQRLFDTIGGRTLSALVRSSSMSRLARLYP